MPFADCWIAEEAVSAAAAVMASGWMTMGPETTAFEEDFASWVGASHAVAVSSCTAAIELALRSLHLPRGSLVLTSTLTFCGAVQAIVHAELTPVLVDVDPQTGMPTPATVYDARRLCGQPAAMVVVHWAGDPIDVDALATAAGVPRRNVVEDAAHALGAALGDRLVGRTEGTACFSFYATKNLPVGEGGMVTTDDPDTAAWLRTARLHGMSADAWRRYLPGGGWRYDVPEAGLKANLTDLQAAIGRAQLRHLVGWQARRAEIAARYDTRLSGLAGVSVPHRPPPGTGTHAWHLYAVRLGCSQAARDRVIDRMAARGVGTSVHFVPVHQLSYFRTVAAVQPGGLPGADHIAQRLLSLPIYPRLADEAVDRVCHVLSEALADSEEDS